MPVLPIVVSVPNTNKCLVSVETKLNLDAVGALDKAVALDPVPPDVSQINVPPSKTVAIKSSPKLSKDQFLPTRTTSDAELADPQAPLFHVSVPQPNPYVDVDGPMFI